MSKEQKYLVTGDTRYNDGKTVKSLALGQEVGEKVGKELAKYGKAGLASNEDVKAFVERRIASIKRSAARVKAAGLQAETNRKAAPSATR